MNTLWWTVLVVVAVLALLKFGRVAAGTDAPAARTKIAHGALVIDVRTPAEYSSGHYEGATNIPLGELRDRLPELGDKKKAIVVYCASGMRSASAARILKDAGFTDVTNAGGLNSLAK